MIVRFDLSLRGQVGGERRNRVCVCVCVCCVCVCVCRVSGCNVCVYVCVVCVCRVSGCYVGVVVCVCVCGKGAGGLRAAHWEFPLYVQGRIQGP